MKTTRSVAAAVLLLCIAGASSDLRYDEEAKEVVALANNLFTTRLYEILARSPGNVLFSPLSVQTVLSLAWLGAGGETGREMTAALHLPEDRDLAEKGFQTLLSCFQSSSEDVTLEMANKIFAKRGSDIYHSFRTSAKKNFQAEIQEVNFRQPVSAAQTINDWVAHKTRNRIRNLISSESLDQNTLMVLVNAIYFKGKWLTQFEPRHTSSQDFFLNSKSTKSVEMMRIKSQFQYAEVPELEAKVIQLPYVGQRLSMLVLLPNDVEGLASLEARLSQKDLRRITSQLYATEVGVSFPKFKLETSMELNAPLQELGMVTMFGAYADFSGIAKHNLAVSSVVQKAFIEVTEEGSEAAAASGVQIVALSGAITPSRTKSFNADHPFLFFIQENETGTVLFMGKFSAPE